MRRRSAVTILLAATAASLVACGHAQKPYVTTCPPPKVVFVVGGRDIAASHCDQYFAQPTETLHVGQRIKAVARAGEAVPFSDDERVLRVVSRSADGRTVEYQALRRGSAGLDIHFGPPCPRNQETDEVASPRSPGTDVCALLPIHIVSAN